MSTRNKLKCRELYAAGASLGRIASALNCSVLAVAYELTQKDAQ